MLWVQEVWPIVATWDDSDEETSDDEEHQEMTNLALMAIGD